MPILYRRSFQRKKMPSPVVWGINPDFSGLFPSIGQVAYVLRTRAPVVSESKLSCYPSTCMC